MVVQVCVEVLVGYVGCFGVGIMVQYVCGVVDQGFQLFGCLV